MLHLVTTLAVGLALPTPHSGRTLVRPVTASGGASPFCATNSDRCRENWKQEVWTARSVHVRAAVSMDAIKITTLELPPAGFVWGETFVFDDAGTVAPTAPLNGPVVGKVVPTNVARVKKAKTVVQSWYDAGVRLQTPPQAPLSKSVRAAASEELAVDKLIIKERLGEGTQSEVLLGELPGEHIVAVKVGLKMKALAREAAVLSAMAGVPGFPVLLHHEGEGPLAAGGFLLLELLGPSLDDLRRDKSSYLAGPALLGIGREVICLLRELHRAGFVHNDVKPANILLGKGALEPTGLHIIDFGSCTRLESHATEGEDFASSKGIIGTAKFASVAGDDCDQSMRPIDDIESLVYTLVYLATNSLPWQNMPDAVAVSMKQELHASSSKASELIDTLSCATSAAALQSLWAEVRRWHVNTHEGSASTSVDYEACLAALDGEALGVEVEKADEIREFAM